MVSKKIMKTFNFDHEPTFAELWDRCVYELIYTNPRKYAQQLSDLFQSHGVTKDSAILDTCTGSGFPSLDMYELGYRNITFVDGSDDQIELFLKKAKAKSLDIPSKKYLWQELPKHFAEKQFKALICKASIWYAAGGWNKDFQPKKETTLKVLKKTLSIFYDLLDDGGVLYLDKFKDDEVDHKDTVGMFEFGKTKKEIIFYTHREGDVRKAQMIVRDLQTGKEEGLPNITYNLKEAELEKILKDVGFSVIKPSLSEEKFFVSWLAIKNPKL